jgi:hypothetical protein
MRTKLYPLAKISTEEDEDIIFVEYGQNLDVTLTLAEEIVANRIDFTTGKNHYVIFDTGTVKSLTSDAKSYLLNPSTGTKNILGAAFIASNPVAALIANIFIKSSKNFPAKFFSKKTDALNWIKELKTK